MASMMMNRQVSRDEENTILSLRKLSQEEMDDDNAAMIAKAIAAMAAASANNTQIERASSNESMDFDEPDGLPPPSMNRGIMLIKDEDVYRSRSESGDDTCRGSTGSESDLYPITEETEFDLYSPKANTPNMKLVTGWD